jgi:hypothetical protein
MNTDHIYTLRQYNAWRRGGDDPQVDPRAVGEAIDWACDEVARLAAENQQLRNALTVPSDFVRQPCIDGMMRVPVSQYNAALSGGVMDSETCKHGATVCEVCASEDLQAEIERLRAALEAIAAIEDYDGANTCWQMESIAQAALSGKGE